MDPTPDTRPQKRRKTMGDTPSSSFHTQTITQFLSTAGDDEDVERFDDSEVDREEDNEEDPKTVAKSKGQVPEKALSHVTDSRATSMIPQTPVHKKTRSDVWEVPSSQPTPGTPIAITPLDTERFRIPPLRSPLQELTNDINHSASTLPTSGAATKRPRKMVIEDSYSSAPGFPSSDPRPSPSRVSRLPYITEAPPARASMELGESVPGERPSMGAVVEQPSAANTRRPLGEIELEIPDSDDELLSLGPTPVKSTQGAALPPTLRDTPISRRELPVPTTPKVSTEDELEIESSDAGYDPGSPTPVARKVHSNPRPGSLKVGDLDKPPSSSNTSGLPEHRTAVTPTPASRNIQIQGPEAFEADILTSTPLTSQLSVTKSLPSQNTRSHNRIVRIEAPEEKQDEGALVEMVTATPLSSSRPTAENMPSLNTDSPIAQVEGAEETQDEDVTQDTPVAKSQFYTQGLESQRVPLEVIRSMAPQTDRSDIIISIHPEPADLIASGTKNHEFRNYKIPNTVSRIWLYITRPACELRYMAVIGPAKQPGEIDEHSGIGNREFNAQAGSKFAYELLQVYQLNNPVSLARMKENGWMEGPPQKYVYVPPAVVGQLLGNLRCALFADETQSNHAESQHILSTPQQIEDQLRSDIVHSTQLLPDGALDNAIELSSQHQPSSQAQLTPTARTASDDVFARPQLPASKTPASAQRLPTLPRLPPLPSLPPNKDADYIRPSQATTASEASSPAMSPDKSVPRPNQGSSGPSLPDYGEDETSIWFVVGQHYSLGSSQVRLPESLMVDDFRPPPDIRDSDEEEDDD